MHITRSEASEAAGCRRVGGRRRFIAASIAGCLLAALAVFALPAQAARVHPLLLSENLPEARTPERIAINQVTHHFYVSNSGTNGVQRRVFNYEENGQIDPVSPELTGAPELEPLNVAVDNSGGSHAGSIYVASEEFRQHGGEGEVQQFDPAGVATGVTITKGSIPADGTSQGGGLPPVVNDESFRPRAISVDGAGNVFVVNVSPTLGGSSIDVFDPTGAFVKQIALGKVAGGTAMAIDAAGDIYLAKTGTGGLGKGLFELNDSGECVQIGCAAIDPAPITGVGLDQADGTIFTITGGEFNEGRGEFSEYDATTHLLLGVTRPAQLREPQGIAVNEDTGEVIVTDEKPASEGTIQIYGGVQIVPDVETLSPTSITDRSATLKGRIGAAEVPGATCVFQYVDQEEFEASRFEGAPTAECEPSGPFSGTTMNDVEAKVEGLRGGTTYHERILGTNENGSNPGVDIPFTTLGPTVSNSEAVEIGQSAATLNALVDPNGSATSYRFEYLTEADYDANPPSERFVGAREVPSGGQAIGGGATSVAVSQRIEGLNPGTAYVMRIRAVSGAGETLGPDIAFTTARLPVAGPPDDRRYEQVTPVDKNGANAQGAINAVQASLSGDRITFFANTGIPGNEGTQQFPTYMASRDADGSGWSTRGLLPPASYGPRAYVLGWSESLADTYEFATPAFAPGKLLRRSSDGGGLTAIGTIEASTNPFAFAGTSGNGSVALLEAKRGGLLPGDLAGKRNVYAFDRETGAGAVAGVLNDGSVPSEGAIAGPYAWFSNQTTLGGPVERYFTQSTNAISTDGKTVFFTAAGSGQLYARLNPLAGQSAMSGEECIESRTKGCTIQVSAPEQGVSDPGTPAAFVGASADGHLVYFLDKGKLTTDATGGVGFDLYRYDVQSGELTDLTLDTADKKGAQVEGVLGIGRNGEDLYFVATGSLAEGATEAPFEETNLYALHGDAIELIGRLTARLSNGLPAQENHIWRPSSAEGQGTVPHDSRVSTDGQTVLFRSSRRLTAYNNHGQFELYLDRRSQGVDCISCNPTGQAATGSASLQGIIPPKLRLERFYAFMTRNLSADGRRVIFDSTEQLVPADENEVNDVYEWEVPGKGSCTESSGSYYPTTGGCLYLISGGATEGGPSYFGDADEEGENVFFFTAQSLVAQDRDELIDIYDARVDGGIPGQQVTPSAPCQEERGCLEEAAPPPQVATPQSPGANGTNVTPPPRCRKGFARKHGKCVRHKKPHHRHHHKSKRRSQKRKNGKSNINRRQKQGNSGRAGR